jgi:hypothetical protein
MDEYHDAMIELAVALKIRRISLLGRIMKQSQNGDGMIAEIAKNIFIQRLMRRILREVSRKPCLRCECEYHKENELRQV